jgi:hypothetical protein
MPVCCTILLNFLSAWSKLSLLVILTSGKEDPSF